MLRWLACCYIGVIASAGAGEATFAWHLASMPSSSGSEDPVKNVESPPSSTIFISRGDRLVDLSFLFPASVRTRNDTWLIWNETRRLLVAHGGALAIAYVGTQFDYSHQPRKVGVTLSWYKNIVPGEVVPTGAKPVHQLELFGKSRNPLKGVSRLENGEGIVSVEHDIIAEPDPDAARSIVNMKLDWTESAGSRSFDWALSTEVGLDTLHSSPRTVFQASSPGGVNWTITAAVRDLFLDDVPVADGVQAEINGKAVSCYGPAVGLRDRSTKVRLGEADYRVNEYEMPRHALCQLIGFAARSDDADEKSGPDLTIPEALLRLPEMDIPPGLRSLAPLPMLDLGPLSVILARKTNDPVIQGAIIGYEPISQRLLIALPSDTDASRAFSWIPYSCAPAYGLSMLIDSTARKGEEVIGERKIGVTASTGHQASVTCMVPETSEEESSPLIDCKLMGMNAELKVDLQYDLQLAAFAWGPSLKSKGDIQLTRSVSTPLQSLLSGQVGTTLSVKAERVPIHPHVTAP